MIITKLSGGIGNQMFQFAAARALSIKWKQEMLIDTSLFSVHYENVDKRAYALDIFKNIKPAFSSKFLSSGFYMHSRWDNRIRGLFRLRERKVLREEIHSFDERFNLISPPVLLDGYWQTEKYFKEYGDIIRNDFTLPELESTDDNLPILQKIRKEESVSVHVRRGDYVKYGTNNMFFGICDVEYYKNAIQYLIEKKSNLKFYFFSEDPVWIKENLLNNNIDGTVITGNYGKDSWKDMLLMSHCRHNILANSSFSWWSAWLNNSFDKIIITPKKWFKTDDLRYEPNDIVPESWIRLS